jgi:hypothetical protein
MALPPSLVALLPSWSSPPASVLLGLLALVAARTRSKLRSLARGNPPPDAGNSLALQTTHWDLHSSRKEKCAPKPKHALIPDAVPMEELARAFEQGVLPYYREMQLPSYSRYETWTQSSYMEIHPRWTPQPPINAQMYAHLQGVQERCRRVFAQWYCDLHGLQEVEVTTLNSFVTKYVPATGKSEFGKHVDGARVHGSLVLALPTDEPHDWPGMLVWDGPKRRGPAGRDPRPEHLYQMLPGDALVLDRIVWHHGLPITKGSRFVVVNFYEVRWLNIKGEHF